MKQLISIREAITQAVEQTTEDHLDLFPTLITWARKAEDAIGSDYTYEDNIIALTVQNYRAKLPIATKKVVAIIDGDQTASGYEAFYNNWNNYIETELPYFGEDVIFRWNVSGNVYRPFPLKWKVVDNTILFETNPNVAEITVLAKQYKTDEEGLPMINENHITAIALYIKWQLAELERYKKFRKLRLSHIDNNYVAELKDNWIKARNAARGEDLDVTEDQLRMASEMLNNPLSGNGLLNIH